MEDRIKKFESALCDVRKAHRLIYAYQERMLSLVKFIQHKLDMNVLCGYKHFSDPIHGRTGKYQRVFENMWAWDFIYSYVYEYFICEGELEGGGSYYVSLIQYSDTGFFENENDDKCSVEKFTPEEESGSKIMFVLEMVPPKCKKIWATPDYLTQIVGNKEYSSIKHTNTILYPKGKGKNAIVLYSIPLSRFIDEKSTMAALQEYVNFLKENDIIDIDLA